MLARGRLCGCVSHHWPKRHHSAADLFHLHALLFIEWNVADVHSHLLMHEDSHPSSYRFCSLKKWFLSSPKAPRRHR